MPSSITDSCTAPAATASRLTWTAGWENLASFFLYSALLQTSMHRAVEHRA